MEATGTPTWSTASAGRHGTVCLPDTVRRVELWADHDAGGAGQGAAERRPRASHREGREVVVLLPEEPGTDWLDVRGTHGADALVGARQRARPWLDPRNPWRAIQSAAALLSEPDPAHDGEIEPRLIFREMLTEITAPRGLGKTNLLHAILVRLAQAGLRVLIIDRDNPRRLIKTRLRGWGVDPVTNPVPTLQVITREKAPPMTDRAAWAQFPLDTFDVVLVDSYDASTEGTGEQDICQAVPCPRGLARRLSTGGRPRLRHPRELDQGRHPRPRQRRHRGPRRHRLRGQGRDRPSASGGWEALVADAAPARPGGLGGARHPAEAPPGLPPGPDLHEVSTGRRTGPRHLRG